MTPVFLAGLVALVATHGPGEKPQPAATPLPAAQAATAAPAVPPAVAPAGAEKADSKAPEGPAAVVTAPLFDEAFTSTPVARVAGQVITLGELTDGLATAHQDAGTGMAGKKDINVVLQRLVDGKLIIAEARDIGIADDKKVQDAIALFKETELREALRRAAVRDAKPDEGEVQRLYRDMVREWKVRSVLTKSEEDAKAIRAAVKAGKSFEEAAAEAVAAGRAEGNAPPAFFSREVLAPHLVAVLQNLAPDEVSAPIEVKGGFTLMQFVDLRYPEGNAKARNEAEQQVSQHQRKEILGKLLDEMTAKYAKYDRALLKQLDYHSVKRFEALTKDKRPLVRIKGEAPITVAELTAELRKDMYHGIEPAIRDKKLNNKKEPKLESLVAKRLATKEALVRGIDKSPEYLRAVAAYEDSVIFGSFVQKIIIPDVNIMESELKAYYDAHQEEFSYPEMLKLDGVAYADVKDAQSALGLLQKGSDLDWVKANTQNQVPEERRTVQLGGMPLATSGMPEDMRAALSGAKEGTLRLYAAKADEAWVLSVVEHTPSSPQPYVETREIIAKKLYGEKVSEAIKQWTAKLREHHDVEIFVSRVAE